MRDEILDLAEKIRNIVDSRIAAALAAHAASPVDADPWLPHTSWGLGSRRRCAELARRGAIEGARRAGKLWLARRSAIDAYVTSLASPTSTTTSSYDPIAAARAARQGMRGAR